MRHCFPAHNAEKRVCRITLVIERINEVFTAVDNISNDVTLSPTSIPRVIMAECVELDLKGDAKARSSSTRLTTPVLPQSFTNFTVTSRL